MPYDRFGIYSNSLFQAFRSWEREEIRRGWDKRQFIRLLIIPSLWCIQSLPSLTEQSKMKAIEQWSPKIFVDLSHGLEPRFDPSKPARPVFFCFFVFCFFWQRHSALFSHLSSTLFRLNWCKNIKVKSTTPLSYPSKSNIVLPRAMRVSPSTTT